MASKPEIYILDDVSQWAAQAVALTRDVQHQAVEEHGRFLFALSGGRTPELVYQRLTTVSSANEWTSTDFFFGDERCVPPDHPDSNYHLAEQALFRPLNIRQDHIHRMRGEHRDPAIAASEYEDELRSMTNTPPGEWPLLDLVILGVGNDGHTASLFPGTEALHEDRRWVTVGRAPSGPTMRLTLTLGVINHATVVLFLTNGESKAGIVKRILEPEEESDRLLPSALVRPNRGRLLWLLDRPAAAKLTGPYKQNHPRPT